MNRGIRTALLSALLALPCSLAAQGTLREQTTALSGRRPERILAVNPFLPLAGYVQAEYEQRLQDNASMAVATSYAPFNNRDYFNLDVKLRLYPQDRALEGLGLAAGLGVGRARQNDQFGACAPVDCEPPRIKGKMLTAPTFSVEGQYQWLMGASRSTAVTVAGGMKRYFFDEADTRGRGVNRLLPTGRLTIGWVFR